MREDLPFSEEMETAEGTTHSRIELAVKTCGVQVHLYSLTSVLDGVEWSLTHSGHFASGNRVPSPVPLDPLDGMLVGPQIHPGGF